MIVHLGRAPDGNNDSRVERDEQPKGQQEHDDKVAPDHVDQCVKFRSAQVGHLGQDLRLVDLGRETLYGVHLEKPRDIVEHGEQQDADEGRAAVAFGANLAAFERHAHA